jgi:thiol-disulfide isomerase/thioredoxin
LLGYVGEEVNQKPGTVIGFLSEEENKLSRFLFNQKHVEPISATGLAAWANKMIKMKLYRELFTEQLPKHPISPGGVEYLVGSNFEEKMNTNFGKHRFVKFFADWCPHCQDLRHTFESLAAANKGNSKIYFAEFDNEKNETSNINIESYPTLIYFSPNDTFDKEVYDGDLDVQTMTRFLNDKIEEYEKFQK